MYLAGMKEINEPHDEKDSLDFMLKCWSRSPCILLIDDGNIVGFAGLTTYVPENDKKSVYLRDYHFYIHPSKRGIKSWRMLARAVQSVSEKFNLPFFGEHRLQGDINHHLRLIRMAGAKPFAVLSMYGEKK